MARKEEELIRVCKFIGYESMPRWHEESEKTNVSSERVRRFRFYSLVIESPVAEYIRRKFVPKTLRQIVKNKLKMKDRPTLSAKSFSFLKETFDEDLNKMSQMLNIDLCCDNYQTKALTKYINWV